MFRIFSIISIFALALILVTGCEPTDGKRFRTEAELARLAQDPGFAVPAMGEVDLVEKLASSREQYAQDLATLKRYYGETGSHKKHRWSDKETKAFTRAPKYKYLMAAETAGARLDAIAAITDADELYRQGMSTYRDAVVTPPVFDRKRMRQSLSIFNKLIDDFPTSDKIDDAAYRAGDLYEKFGDYSIAVTYYQRAYQWNDATPYPARYKAARILDEKLMKRDAALFLYQQCIEKESKYGFYVKKAQKRIEEMTITEPDAEDVKEIERSVREAEKE